MRGKGRYFTVLSLAMGVILWLVSANLQQASAKPTADRVVYADSLASGWSNWSWNTTVNFNNTSPVFGGSKSIAATLNQAWAGLSLRTDTPVLPSQHYTLTLRVHGGVGSPKQLRFYVQENDASGAVGQYDFTVAAGTWMAITRTFADLGDPAQVARITIMDRAGFAQGTFYVDEIRWLSAPSSVSLAVTVTIQASNVLTPFLPEMLASNLPAWLGPTRFGNATFRARTAASGLTLLRLPGGSWSNSYGWLSCEMGSNQPGVEPCGPVSASWAPWASRPTDFINFLKATGMRGMWVVNPNSTSKEAAALVAFMNGSVNDSRLIGTDIRGTNWYTVGRWAALRVAGGNPDPVGIKLWEFGNEMYASKSSTASSSSAGLCVGWAWEDTWTCDGYEYVNGVGSGSSRREGYLEFRQQMQLVDPTITLAAVGMEYPGTPSDVGGPTYSGWGSRVISAAGAHLEMYAIHPYPFFNLPSLMSQVLASPQTHWPTIMSHVRSAFNIYGGGRQAPVAVTEFNLVSVSSQDTGQWMTRAVNALFLADSLGQAAQQGAVLFAQWDLANGRDGSSGSEYGLMHEDNGFFRAPQYYVYPLWSRFGTRMVEATSTADPASQVSVYAGWVNTSTVSLLAVNKMATPVIATIQTPGFGPLIGGMKWQIVAASLGAQNVTYNGVLNPTDDLSNAPPTALTVSGYSTTQVLPPYSVTLFHLQQPPPSYPPRVWTPIVRR